MNIFRTLHRSILLLFAVVVVSIVTLVHISVSKIVAEQSRAQQQSYSPALQLIVEQLMQPLHISQTLAKAKELKDLIFLSLARSVALNMIHKGKKLSWLRTKLIGISDIKLNLKMQWQILGNGRILSFI